MGRRTGDRGSVQRASRQAGVLHTQIIDHQSPFINRSGFTLIELLVVISILVMLMAILLPSLQRVRRQTQAVVCQSNLRQWGALWAIYVSENDGRLPVYYEEPGERDRESPPMAGWWGLDPEPQDRIPARDESDEDDDVPHRRKARGRVARDRSEPWGNVPGLAYRDTLSLTPVGQLRHERMRDGWRSAGRRVSA